MGWLRKALSTLQPAAPAWALQRQRPPAVGREHRRTGAEQSMRSPGRSPKTCWGCNGGRWCPPDSFKCVSLQDGAVLKAPDMSLAWFGVHGKFLQWPESLPERSCIISVQVLLAMCRGQGPPKEALTAMHSHQATQIGMLTRQRASTLMLFDPCGSTQQAF